MGVVGGAEPVTAEVMDLAFTSYRQGCRAGREEVAAELAELRDRLLAQARQGEWLGWPKGERDVMRAQLEALQEARWVALGKPGMGISTNGWELEYPLLGHDVVLRGVPPRRPVGYVVVCDCDPERSWSQGWGWSPTVIGAKRLARQHAALS